MRVAILRAEYAAKLAPALRQCMPVFQARFSEHVLNLGLDRGLAFFQNVCNYPIGFAFAQPIDDLFLRDSERIFFLDCGYRLWHGGAVQLGGLDSMPHRRQSGGDELVEQVDGTLKVPRNIE